MKIVSIFFLIGGLTFITPPNQTFAKDIIIHATHIEKIRGGNIMAMIFGKDGFPIKHDNALITQQKPANSEIIEFSFSTQRDDFAIKILHDEDETGKVTKNWIGLLPIEGLGFSNGATLNWDGVPLYEAAKIHSNAINSPILIKVIYP